MSQPTSTIRDKMRAALTRFAANHSNYTVREVGGGRAFMVLGAPGCAGLLDLALHFGVGDYTRTGYSTTARAAGDGMILRQLWS